MNRALRPDGFGFVPVRRKVRISCRIASLRCMWRPTDHEPTVAVCSPSFSLMPFGNAEGACPFGTTICHTALNCLKALGFSRCDCPPQICFATSKCGRLKAGLHTQRFMGRTRRLWELEEQDERM